MNRKSGFLIFMCAVALVALTSVQSFAFAKPASFDVSAAERHNDAWGFPHKEGIVLVLSGGGTKGLSHIGVFQILEREHVPIAAIVGTSMGAIMGGLYAAGYSADEMRDVLSRVDLMEIISGRSTTRQNDIGFNRPPASGSAMMNFRMNSDKTLKGSLGVLRAKDLYSFLSELTSRATVTDFDMLPIPFVAMATDLENGEEVRLRDGNLASALRASMSIPGVFDPWEMNGRLLVDGGLRANLPVMAAKAMFPGHPVVAVNLSPEDITRDRKTLRSVLEIGAQTLEILMVEQVRRNAREADLVIAPHVSDFGILASDGYDKIIERGVEAADAHVEELRALSDKAQKMYPDFVHIIPTQGEVPIVADIRFDGIPEHLADTLYKQVEDWKGQPLDMAKAAEMVKKFAAREEISSVEAKTENLTRDSVTLVFSVERPSKYEFGLGGYGSNMTQDSWLAISAQVRDILMTGDVGSLEYRLGNRWGVMGRYFTPNDSRNSQFGLVLSAREEGIEPRDLGQYRFERYSARLAWYKSFSEQFRLGLGYAGEWVDFPTSDTEHGPYFSLSFNNLDDPVLPTKGLSLTSNIWYPIDETLITHTEFTAYLPVWNKFKFVFSGGLKTGDAFDLPYAAALGVNEELYSLARHPLVGDQAYWIHLGAARTVMRSWWGGINVEIFGNYGQTLFDWDKFEDWWEAGLSLSIPMNNFNGKVVIVYDEGGEWTFGYSIGIPNWWSGPLP